MHYIVASLKDGTLVDVEGCDLRLRKTLSHHDGYDTSTGAYIENALSTFCPSTQQHAVCAHFHGTQLLLNDELLKTKHPRLYSLS